MLLSYLALAILIIVIIAVVYLFIWIHDIPYRLAKARNHPNLHAIHIGCWLSLFTLHALWPFIFLWAIIEKPRLEVVVVREEDGAKSPAESRRPAATTDTAALRQSIRDLQARLDALEKCAVPGGKS